MNAPVKITTHVRLADLSDQGLCAQLDEFVGEQGGSLFHRPAWLKAAEKGTGQRGTGLIAERLGAICGWLPLTQTRSMLFGKALISSGFGVGGGILTQDDEIAASLAEAAQAHAERNGFASIEVRGGPVPEGWQAWDHKHCGFERDLAANDEAELLDIPRKARAEVRKGLSNDLSVQVGRGADDLAAHYAVYAQSVRNLGTPVFPRSLFRAMLDAFPNSSDILTISHNGKPVASVLSFYHQGAVMPFWGGGSFAARGLRANELMYFELMRHARQKGAQSFDFGRSKTGSGPYRFKKNWGFEPMPLTYAQWSEPGAEARDVDPTNAAYSRKIALWKKLPLPIANLIGPMIARDLA